MVAGPSGGRQEEMRIIAAAVSGTALLVQTAQHALRDARGDRAKWGATEINEVGLGHSQDGTFLPF